MAASPPFKVYNAAGVYIAACKHAEDAAAIIAAYGSGTIRRGHSRIVWNEGEEDQPAGDSFDHVATVVYARCHTGKE